MYKSFFKRIIDVTLAAIGLLVLFIPMIIIAIAIKVDSKGPVIFRQERLGKNKKNFVVYKFRTMCNHAYDMGGIANSSNDPRITRIGAILRRLSLDELPQMVNILKGEMSIIGPRPILDWEFEEYSNVEKYNKRYKVLPGLFCSVDLDYRAEADRDLQFCMDADYVENMSFIADVKIFFGIIKTVITGKNVYKEDSIEK